LRNNFNQNTLKSNVLRISIALFFYFNSFSQYTGKIDTSNKLGYELHGAYKHPLKKEILDRAIVLNDLINDCPSSWIDKYVSVEISSKVNGKIIKALGNSNRLTAEQKNIIKAAKLGDDVIINSQYQIKNKVTSKIEYGKMSYSITVVPEIEAEYAGGKNEILSYLKNEISVNRLESSLNNLKLTTIKFTVNEKGIISNSIVLKSSTNIQIDQLLLKIINEMPNWKPAQDKNGTNVRQDFEFSVGKFGC
jgi:hypothetical protein